MFDSADIQPSLKKSQFDSVEMAINARRAGIDIETAAIPPEAGFSLNPDITFMSDGYIQIAVDPGTFLKALVADVDESSLIQYESEVEDAKDFSANRETRSLYERSLRLADGDYLLNLVSQPGGSFEVGSTDHRLQSFMLDAINSVRRSIVVESGDGLCIATISLNRIVSNKQYYENAAQLLQTPGLTLVDIKNWTDRVIYNEIMETNSLYESAQFKVTHKPSTPKASGETLQSFKLDMLLTTTDNNIDMSINASDILLLVHCEESALKFSGPHSGDNVKFIIVKAAPPEGTPLSTVSSSFLWDMEHTPESRSAGHATSSTNSVGFHVTVLQSPVLGGGNHMYKVGHTIKLAYNIDPEKPSEHESELLLRNTEILGIKDVTLLQDAIVDFLMSTIKVIWRFADNEDIVSNYIITNVSRDLANDFYSTLQQSSGGFEGFQSILQVPIFDVEDESGNVEKSEVAQIFKGLITRLDHVLGEVSLSSKLSELLNDEMSNDDNTGGGRVRKFSSKICMS